MTTHQRGPEVQEKPINLRLRAQEDFRNGDTITAVRQEIAALREEIANLRRELKVGPGQWLGRANG